MTPAQWSAEEAFFRALAREFKLAPDVLYLMCGQKGSMPAPVLRGMKADIDRIARDPFNVHLEDPRSIRLTIARSYRANVDEVAITHNTTDALSLALMGIDWQPGDEILVSALEHPAGIAPIMRLAARHGVTIRIFGVPSDAAATAQAVVAAAERGMVSGRTKVLYFSSPLWPTGMRMPERELARLAQKHGVITVVDGAHHAGMLEPELSASGIDFWALCGHKWQCGPGGTGILYVRNRVGEANPNPLPRFHLVRSAALDGIPLDGTRPDGLDIGAALTQAGSPESGQWRALAQVCVFWDAIGRWRIEKWILALADYTRQRLIEAFGSHSLLQPRVSADLKSGIVAFNPFTHAIHRSDNAFNLGFRQRLLSEHRIRISGGALGPLGWIRHPQTQAQAFLPGTIPNLDPLTGAPAPMPHPHRVNACVWANRGQIDLFVDCARTLVKEMEA